MQQIKTESLQEAICFLISIVNMKAVKSFPVCAEFAFNVFSAFICAAHNFLSMNQQVPEDTKFISGKRRHKLRVEFALKQRGKFRIFYLYFSGKFFLENFNLNL